MKKTMMILLAAVLVVAISVGGTLAYLTAKTEAVVNTFTAGELVSGDFTLKEHKAIQKADGSYELSPTELVDANEYEVIPGVNIPKDPFVSVNPEIDAYLFVEIVGSTGATWNWGFQEGWTVLDDVQGPHGGLMLWREVKKTGEVQEFYILYDNMVTIAGNFNTENAASMNLDFYAYLCQQASFASATAAWNAVKADFAVSP